jgi:lysozyme
VRANDAGVAIIKEFEGVRLEAYKCPADVWTIGYGHTGPEVRKGLKISLEVAGAMLESDLQKFEDGATKLIGSAPTTPNQFSAMVSLAFNIGLGNLAKSSVLRHHKAGNHKLAAESFLLWNKAKGTVLPGLTRRRMKERGLYLK